MLELVIATSEVFDEETNRFIPVSAKVIRLEYSLKALSKWESKWHCHFINNTSLTEEQRADFILCMVVDGELNISELSSAHMREIEAYVNDPYSATTITAKKKKGAKKNQIMTSEVFYALMAQANVPYSCDEWHMNRLSKVLEVISAFTNGEEKIKETPNERLLRNAELNAKRRAQLNSKG